MRRRTLLALALLAGCSDEPAGEVWFEDVAAESGLVFVHDSGHEPGRYLMPQCIAGGAALFDADGDGDLDAYLVQSGALDGDGRDARNRLFLNAGVDPDGRPRFEDATDGSGADDAGYGMGVACGDYDGDGDVDLYVTNVGPNALLRNEGGGRFTDLTAAAGVGHPGWGTSAAFHDADGDGRLELYVANYLDWSLAGEITCKNKLGQTDYCSPQNYSTPGLDVLYRNLGDGRFQDVSAESGIAARPATGLGVGCADFDQDGRVDVFVANDGMPDFLWRNLGGGRFGDVAARWGCALDQSGVAKAGMGVAIADVDDDGDSDLVVCNLNEQSDSLFLNDGGLFRDRTSRSGLSATSRPFTRFGMGWVDFDLDGRLDLYQANGRVNMQAERYTDDPFAEPNLVYRGLPGPRFEELEPRGGTRRPLIHASRAAAFGDVNDDGAVDVLVANKDAAPYLLLNVAPRRGGWVGLNVLDAHGAPALHARVTGLVGDRRVTREVRAASSYLASSDPRIVVGLGDEDALREVEVRWPDGAVTRPGELAAGRYHELRR